MSENNVSNVFEVVEISEVTLQDLNDILMAAVEGGTGYWAEVRDYRHNGGANQDQTTVEFREEDQESAEKPGWHRVSAMDLLAILPEIHKHSNQAATWNVAEIVENHDGEIADIAVQLVIFGQVIYG